LNGIVFVLRFSSRWNWVFEDETEICDVRPLEVGGQTTTG